MAANALVLLAEGAEEMETVIAVDVLRHVCISGDTLCRDNCQLIGMPFFHTRSAGKNNPN